MKYLKIQNNNILDIRLVSLMERLREIKKNKNYLKKLENGI